MSELDFDFAPLESPALVVSHGAAGRTAPPRRSPSAHAEADAIRAMAHAEGLAAGREEALAALAPAAAALEAAARAVQEARWRPPSGSRPTPSTWRCCWPRRSSAPPSKADPQLVVEAVRGALRGLVERERVTVLVHPDDLDLVRGAMGDLIGSLGGIEHCEVQAERRVARGGAVVRTPEGDVDARIDTKLQRAREVVETALGVA